MAALPYMQLYVADYLADTPHLTTEEHGAYLLLLFSYWQTGKPLRVDRLAHTARLSNERWTSVQRTLSEFFSEIEGVWIHQRVEKDLEKVAEKSGKNSEAGKASAAARAFAKQQLERIQGKSNPTNVATSVERTLNERSTTRDASTIEDTDTDTDTDTEKGQKLSSPGSKKSKKPKSDFELPAWVDQKSWDGFLDMRKLIKKPISENGMGLAIGKLKKLALEGQNPNDVLDQSTFYSWQGLFAIKEEFRNERQSNGQRSGAGRPSLVDRVREANAHLFIDEPPPVDERDWPEFDSLREIDGTLVGPDD